MIGNPKTKRRKNRRALEDGKQYQIIFSYNIKFNFYDPWKDII